VPVTLTWQQIALRLSLALFASFLIGFDRDEHGKTSGIRTNMLVCLAATLAMLQANQLMDSTGKTSSSFVVLDLMRMPLGILTGIGFIGAGAILRKDGLVHGLTTAATLWYITVLGLLFGGGQIGVGIAATAIALLILWALKFCENFLPTRSHGTLHLEFSEIRSPTEAELRALLHQAGFSISLWNAEYRDAALHCLTCDLRWRSKGSVEPATPTAILQLASSPAFTSLTWKT
jgi:putative Mg2+ transporter-C (MgtC) family protein